MSIISSPSPSPDHKVLLVDADSGRKVVAVLDEESWNKLQSVGITSPHEAESAVELDDLSAGRPGAPSAAS